jgi:hypothetical protein
MNADEPDDRVDYPALERNVGKVSDARATSFETAQPESPCRE